MSDLNPNGQDGLVASLPHLAVRRAHVEISDYVDEVGTTNLTITFSARGNADRGTLNIDAATADALLALLPDAVARVKAARPPAERRVDFRIIRSAQ